MYFPEKWVALTPEEWVRQNFLLYLTEVLHYPVALIAVEKKLLVGQRQKRYDIVVHNRSGQPLMVVECKEMNELLNASVLEQVIRYNISLQSPFIIITNGSHCFGFSKQADQFISIAELPPFYKNNL